MQATRLFTHRFIALSSISLAVLMAPAAYAQNVEVRGSQRVDAETIRNYFAGTDPARVNQAVKELYATGLFSNVSTSRVGSRIVVTVVENNQINRVFFEGNSKIKSEVLASEVQSRSRGAYNASTVQADIARINDVYRRGGRGDATVTSRTVDLPNGRVDVVFTINEGSKTGVREINFVGNSAYSAYRLRNIMQTTEMNYLSFFKNTDVYDPDKISSDQELIRRFYLKNGYADFRIIGAEARYDAGAKGYIVTISVDEGRQYRVGNVRVDTQLRDVNPEDLQRAVRLKGGDVYNGDLVEKSIEGVTREVARKGYAFSSARPRGDRDPATGLIDLNFVVEEGPRVYIERINVRGNTRTRDYVIRREFPVGEGDAYNRVLIDKAEKRLNNLGYFKKVKVTNEPGSAPDRVVVNVDVEDQSTGSFGISGGYSTTDKFVAEVSVSESNFLGRGQYARLAFTGGSKTKGVEFSFTEPYFLDYRLSAGFDIFTKTSKNNQYSIYDSTTSGITLRLGIPITDEISLSPRYSLYQTKIEIPNTLDRPYNDCTTGIIPGGVGQVGYVNPNFPGNGLAAATQADAVYNCLSNGEASLAVKDAAGTRITSLVGYTLSYSSLDNNKNPTEGIYAELRQDVAGLGGSTRFLRTTGELRYYYPVWDDVVGFAKLQAGDIRALGGDRLRISDNFNLGPSLVRGFAPSGIGPRDISDLTTNNKGASLGGSQYIGGSLEMQFPIFGLPKDLGLKGALFADAGTLFGYKGRINYDTLVGLPAGSACRAAPQITSLVNGVSTTVNGGQASCITPFDDRTIRSSIGASILWTSPLGPIRFDYAFATTAGKYDVKQAFRFSGGSSF